MEMTEIQCPSCYQHFSVAIPPSGELPCEVDYDCEICCHPMMLRFDGETAEAHSLADL